MVQADHVAGARAALEDRLYAEFRQVRSVFHEVSQKRISGSERKKSKGSAAGGGCVRKDSIDDLKACPVAPHCNEFAIAIGICTVRVHGGFPGSSSFAHLEL